jgi:voltage-gated potassium channel
LSVLVIFLMVLFLASVAEYYLERDVQPEGFAAWRRPYGGRSQP